MRKTIIKRLVFTNQCGGGYIGASEYDGRLSDENILGAFHEIGKTVWYNGALWMLVDGVPQFRITVEPFYQYTKSWFDLVLDAVRRI